MIPPGSDEDAARFVYHPVSDNTCTDLKVRKHQKIQKHEYLISRKTSSVLREGNAPAEAHHGLALRNLEQGKFREAVDEAQMATTLRPDWLDTSID